MNDLLDIHFNKLRTSVLIFKQQFPVDNIFILRQDVAANELQIRNTLIIESTYNTKIIIEKIYVVFRPFQ